MASWHFNHSIVVFIFRQIIYCRSTPLESIQYQSLDPYSPTRFPSSTSPFPLPPTPFPSSPTPFPSSAYSDFLGVLRTASSTPISTTLVILPFMEMARWLIGQVGSTFRATSFQL
ncbi:hypothetical protein AVEN_151416-1 [Araneus ventricosus]|uniref:Uncharacterized protein n=1 Tax=Araneus ventricosus TaxID=182803 RepID=A0A4Y2B175_ARAVE|nr:hypothetical protein AVEN_151416-1 [Araneus ventricosus]